MSTAPTTSKEVTPSQGEKRKFKGDEQPARCVSQCTDAGSENAADEDNEPLPSMKDIILKNLRSNEAAVLEKSMKQLLEVWQGNKIFFTLGGHLAIVRVMDDHPHCKAIQLYGIRVLSKACDNYEHQTAMTEVGGMNTVLAAMDYFEADNKEVQHEGLKALNALIQNKHHANAKLLIAEFNTAPLIADIMKTFKDDEDVSMDACELLNHACSARKLLQKCFFQADAISALAAIIDGHKENSNLRIIACRAMSALIDVE